MTFPHQFMPMLVAEQLYRAFRIGRGAVSSLDERSVQSNSLTIST